MARHLFIEDALNNSYKSFVDKNKKQNLSDFWGKTFGFLEDLVREQIESVLPRTKSEQSELYFLGSFSRGFASLHSDLDLLCVSQHQEYIDTLNLGLRSIFRNYSLKQVSSIQQFVDSSDPKGILSGWFLKPVFNREDAAKVRLKFLSCVESEAVSFNTNKTICSIESFLSEENTKRHNRFGEKPGRVNYNIKYSPGGAVDLMQLLWRLDVSPKKSAPKNTDLIKKWSLFLYKCKTLFNVISDSDSLQLKDAHEYADCFGYFDEQMFFKAFFFNAHAIFEELCREKKINDVSSLSKLLGHCADSAELAHAEVELYKVKGLVLSPSYHIWTVDQHILSCIKEVQGFIIEYKDEFSLSLEDEVCLNWAAFFHDLRKGEKESHSVLGAHAVQDFGEKHGWSSARMQMVSWLVREHLTLVSNAFKRDVFHKDFVKDLALKGCEGRRAVLLFILSCADIKSTNPASWSTWKLDMLKRALLQVLGLSNNLKERLKETVSVDTKGSEVLSGLGAKEFCMVPYELLQKDLTLLSEDGFSFYEHEGEYWVRAFSSYDEFGFAVKFVDALSQTGAYINRAFFRTSTPKELKGKTWLYNWVCVRSGVSLNALENRFFAVLDSAGSVVDKNLEAVGLEIKSFSRIKRTFSKAGYAVVSFQGEDRSGALASAIKVLKAADLSIEWGHAVTWGKEIEDVFGVSFDESADWSFLS